MNLIIDFRSLLRSNPSTLTMVVLGALIAIGVVVLAIQIMLQSKKTDYELAVNAAEDGVKEAQEWLMAQSQVIIPVKECAVAPCLVWRADTLTDLKNKPTPWWLEEGRPLQEHIQDVSIQPRYIIEEQEYRPYEMSPDPQSLGKGFHQYQITAIGFGSSEEVTAFAVSQFTVPFD